MGIAPIIGAIGSLVSGMMAASAANAQAAQAAAVAEANAQRLEMQAKARAQKAQMDAEDIGLQNAGEFGMAAANMASSGFAYDSPSLIQSRNTQQHLGRREQVRTMQQANYDTADLRSQAEIEQLKARNARAAGKMNAQSAMVGGIFGGLNSLVGGASSSGFAGRGSPMQLNTAPVPRSTFFTPQPGPEPPWIRMQRSNSLINPTGYPF